MNRIVWDYLERKSGDGRRRRNRRTGRYMSDRAMSRDYEDERDYEDYAEDRRMRHDYEERDYADARGEKLSLSKSDMHEWKRKLRNADGSKGIHYDTQQIMQAAEKIGMRFREYDEKELCMVVNMLYSDYCEVTAKYIPHEKALMFYVELAKAFLEDEDAPEGSEKLALYYHCIVCDEEV